MDNQLNALPSSLPARRGLKKSRCVVCQSSLPFHANPQPEEMALSEAASLADTAMNCEILLFPEAA
jgi:hypothetical protein